MNEFTFNDHLEQRLSTEEGRREYSRESLIVDTAVALNKVLEQTGLTQKGLAKKLRRTEGFVSQVLSGGGNLTLRTLADFAYGLGCKVDIVLTPHLSSRFSIDSGLMTRHEAHFERLPDSQLGVQVTLHFRAPSSEQTPEFMSVSSTFQLLYRVHGLDELAENALRTFVDVNSVHTAWPYWRRVGAEYCYQNGLARVDVASSEAASSGRIARFQTEAAHRPTWSRNGVERIAAGPPVLEC